MRRAAQLAAAGRFSLASSTRTPASCQQLLLQQLHSTASPEASASAAAEPAFAADAPDGAVSASNLDFVNSRLHINDWGAVSSIPENDPAPHLRVSPSTTAGSCIAGGAAEVCKDELIQQHMLERLHGKPAAEVHNAHNLQAAWAVRGTCCCDCCCTSMHCTSGPAFVFAPPIAFAPASSCTQRLCCNIYFQHLMARVAPPCVNFRLPAAATSTMMACAWMMAAIRPSCKMLLHLCRIHASSQVRTSAAAVHRLNQ